MIIKGKIDKKLFPKKSSASDSGYKIYAFIPDDQTGLQINSFGNIAICGTLPDMMKNFPYELEVEETSKNGRISYNVKKILTQIQPTTGDEAFTYMCEITTPTRASAILEVYPNIIDMVKNGEKIDTKPIKGVGDKIMSKISEKIKEQYVYYDLIVEFKEYDLTNNQIKRLLDKHGNSQEVRKQMAQNPYGALVSCVGIGFVTADDKILKKHPHLITSKFRMVEAISYLLSQNEQEGSTYMSEDDLFANAKELVPECIQWFGDALEKSPRFYYSKYEERVAKARTFECEQNIANMLMKLNDKQFPPKEDGSVWWKPRWKDASGEKIDSRFIDDKYKKIGDITLTADQQKLIPTVIDNNVVMLLGVAGAGKSSSAQVLIEWLEDNHKAYLLLAPTGRAAAVLSGYTGRPTSTIHRTLIPKGEGRFVYNSGNKLFADIVIVDEATMVDAYLMEALLSALPDYCKVLFVADPAQISSVGCGNVIQDMIHSGKFATVMLDKVFRYGEGGLAYVATQVRKGIPYLKKEDVQVFGNNEDYVFYQADNDNVVKMAINKYLELHKSGVSENDMVIVSCYNKGQYGTLEINNKIQSIINPPKKKYDGIVGYTKDKVEIRFNVGDRVMQTQNNYHVKIYRPESDEDFDDECIIYNGDFGTIIEITKDDELICVFGENKVKIPKQEVNTLLLGYSVSCHKMQGDSRKHVLFISPKSHAFFLSKNLIYVALTRAKEKMYHFGDRDTVRKSLFKAENLERKTFLERLLRNYEK